jgi:hypothetical protein
LHCGRGFHRLVFHNSLDALTISPCTGRHFRCQRSVSGAVQ